MGFAGSVLKNVGVKIDFHKKITKFELRTFVLFEQSEFTKALSENELFFDLKILFLRPFFILRQTINTHKTIHSHKMSNGSRRAFYGEENL